MSQQIEVEAGTRLVATVLFLTGTPLFVSILGPAGISFGSTWACETKEIANESNDTWRLSVQASHGGPLGSEVSVRVIHQSGSVTLIGVGRPEGFEALLVCAVVPRS